MEEGRGRRGGVREREEGRRDGWRRREVEREGGEGEWRGEGASECEERE